MKKGPFWGAYFWRGLFSEGLSMEGNLRFNIDWASLIFGSKFTVLHCFTLYLRAISKYKPPGGLYLEGRFNGALFALRFWGAYIWRGLFSEFYGSFGQFLFAHSLFWEILMLKLPFAEMVILNLSHGSYFPSEIRSSPPLKKCLVI